MLRWAAPSGHDRGSQDADFTNSLTPLLRGRVDRRSAVPTAAGIHLRPERPVHVGTQGRGPGVPCRPVRRGPEHRRPSPLAAQPLMPGDCSVPDCDHEPTGVKPMPIPGRPETHRRQIASYMSQRLGVTGVEPEPVEARSCFANAGLRVGWGCERLGGRPTYYCSGRRRALTRFGLNTSAFRRVSGRDGVDGPLTVSLCINSCIEIAKGSPSSTGEVEVLRERCPSYPPNQATTSETERQAPRRSRRSA